MHPLIGVTWNLKDLSTFLGGADKTDVSNKFLYEHKGEFNVKNGGFILYPTSSGAPFKIKALPMAKYIDEHWIEVMKIFYPNRF